MKKPKRKGIVRNILKTILIAATILGVCMTFFLVNGYYQAQEKCKAVSEMGAYNKFCSSYTEWSSRAVFWLGTSASVIKLKLQKIKLQRKYKKEREEKGGLLKEKCSDGDMESCFQYGRSEYYIQYLSHDKKEAGFFKEAKFFLQKACDDNLILACLYAGLIVKREGDLIIAEELFKKVCHLDIAYGCAALGETMEKMGRSNEASIFYEKACDGKIRRACFRLGIIKEKKCDLKSAEKLHHYSCSLGYHTACFHLDRPSRLTNRYAASLTGNCL